MAQPGRTVTLTTADGVSHQIDSDVDALFLSPSAVEKFLIPYYARLESPDELNKIMEAVESPDVVAIVHVRPSNWIPVRSPLPSA
jgi:hypothetical protein